MTWRDAKKEKPDTSRPVYLLSRTDHGKLMPSMGCWENKVWIDYLLSVENGRKSKGRHIAYWMEVPEFPKSD